MAVCQLNVIFPLLNLDHSMCQGICACFCLGEENVMNVEYLQLDMS